MSDISTAVVAVSPVPIERAAFPADAAGPRAGRTFWGLLAWPFVALWHSWSTPDTTLDVRQYSDADLIDMGASQEMLAEAQALREFELSRAHALGVYYW